MGEEVNGVLGQPGPGRFRDHALLGVTEKRLLHTRKNDEEVSGAVKEVVKELRQGGHAVGTQIVHLVEAEEEGLAAVERQLREGHKHLLDLLVVSQLDAVFGAAAGAKPQSPRLVGVERVAREPA